MIRIKTILSYALKKLASLTGLLFPSAGLPLPVTATSLSFLFVFTFAIFPGGRERPPVNTPDAAPFSAVDRQAAAFHVAPHAFDYETLPEPVPDDTREEKAQPATAPPPRGRALAQPLETLPGTPDYAPPPEGWTPPDVTRGDTRRAELAVTFDGGYQADDARVILDELKKRGIKTTIFLTGIFIKNFPELTRRIVADGHEVGNHTMTHPHLTDYARDYRQTTRPGVDRNFLTRELRATEELFHETTGVEMAPLWRAPYGEVNGELRRWAFEAGYVHIGWTNDYQRRESLDTLDWVSDRSSRFYRTGTEIKRRILGFGKGRGGVAGGIILMHLGTDRKADTAADQLGAILDSLIKKGYRFVKASRLVKEKDGYAIRAARRIMEERRNNSLAGLKVPGPGEEKRARN